MTPDKILLAVCKEKGIKTTLLCDNYVLKLEKSGKIYYFPGRFLGLNSDASSALAADKTATFTILRDKNIPAVPHYFCSSLKDLKKQSFPLVIKPNSGTHGGMDVFLVKTMAEATSCTKNLFKKYNSLALSPFISAPHEYRCFVLNNKAYLIYQKSHGIDQFHFNLSRGATAKLIEEGATEFKVLSSLAVSAASALNLSCATIDILDGKVLEAHSAPASTHLINQLPAAAPYLRSFYRATLDQLFL